MERLERAVVVESWCVASLFLVIAFSVQQATPKLVNNAFYAILCCQIKKLPWSDPALRGYAGPLRRIGLDLIINAERVEYCRDQKSLLFLNSQRNRRDFRTLAKTYDISGHFLTLVVV